MMKRYLLISVFLCAGSVALRASDLENNNNEIENKKKKSLTMEELQSLNLATKNDLNQLVTKDDVKNFVTKTDLSDLAKKNDLLTQEMVKNEVENLLGKDNISSFKNLNDKTLKDLIKAALDEKKSGCNPKETEGGTITKSKTLKQMNWKERGIFGGKKTLEYGAVGAVLTGLFFLKTKFIK